MRAKTRGRFRVLVEGNGAPVTFALSGCEVVRPPYRAGDKWYARFDVSRALGTDALKRADAEIQRLARPRFSPARDLANVVTKLDSDLAVGFPGDLEPGRAVDLVVRPGPFGDFGWCLNVTRIAAAGSCARK